MIVYDNIITDMTRNKKFKPVAIEPFIGGGKVSISVFFVTQSCFAIPKNIRSIFTYYFIIKISNIQNFTKLYLVIHLIFHLINLQNYMKMHIGTMFF